MPLTANGTAHDLHGPEGAFPVVLIHGLGLTRQTTWAHLVPLLAKDFRVITYDLPGHGESALPSAPVSLSLLSRQLFALLDELGIESAALAGFSLGGMINRRCAIDHPGRVSALAILNSPHERDAELQELVERQARDAGAGGPAATIDAALQRWFTPEFHQQHPGPVALIRETVLANDPQNYAAHRQVLAEGVRELIRPNPPIAQPALVMTCENDTGSTPAMSEAIGNEIAGSEVAIVPNLRHLGLVEEPALFAETLIRFLQRVRD